MTPVEDHNKHLMVTKLSVINQPAGAHAASDRFAN